MSDYISEWNEYPATIYNIYPLTVVKDRYTGTYSGGKFTAWNLEPNEVPLEIQDSDVPCACFWRGEKEVLAGRGEAPILAISDLCRRLNKAAERTGNPSATEEAEE